ncbi:hypothetical protein [Methanococcoides burtonii]|uniref:Uncharacterized protein n=1 Tax=Methanococcoides burtonii (strain DSM 6242 / NBRC 107633 / OCM 468 / ACE-M) TaxID=259564 RepID=Q12YT2_METBU|nr:hypothetical protein [Methanococcoides burtonii]ABE51394.1 Hypothetical protein Mbur_0402 [Methanococcoides burtonii DSM 6242]
MKIRTFSVIAVTFMLVSLLAVSAIAAGQERGAGMNSFIGADVDGRCNNFIDGDGVCDNFIDEDGDGINDNSLGLGHGSRDGNGDKKQKRKGDRTCIE